MSSCNALPQIWAIKPTRTMGCAFKRSCNGGVGLSSEALQELFPPVGMISSTGSGESGKDNCSGSSSIAALAATRFLRRL
jgi:hypothetical protein